MVMSFHGIGVAKGVVIGRVRKLSRGVTEVHERSLLPDQVDNEVERFHRARATARAQLQEIRADIPEAVAAEVASFVDTHLLMLEDQNLSTVVVDRIRREHCNAEWALRMQANELIAVFEQMDDEYLRSRKQDIEHVVQKVLQVLTDQNPAVQLDDDIDEPQILVADDISPADMLGFAKQYLAGFVTEFGGPLSHTAILARSLGVPGAVGVRLAHRMLRDGELVILDGNAGVVLASPDERGLEYYRGVQNQEQQRRIELQKLRFQETVTADGNRVVLRANVEIPEDIEAAVDVGAEGVGLFRTEFLYMGRKTIPSEEEQLEHYLLALDLAKGDSVTIRTLDLGADKTLDGGGRYAGAVANNPALGLRAIRLCLKDPTLFKPQLRALLRASAHGPLKIMLPMISNLQELRQAQQAIEQTKLELRNAGIDYNPDVPVGAMVEVPAMALLAEVLALNCDFLSIGTNDLIQYTLAIDRIDDEVNYLYEPLHPAVIRFLKLIIDAGEKTNTPVAMCGEMAGDDGYTRLLLGLGLREFSMHPATLLETKGSIKSSISGDLEPYIARILEAHDSAQIAAVVKEINAL